MENAYLKDIGRPQNFTFTHVEGGSWDVVSLGFYKDLKHFAARRDVPPDEEEAAAKAAGFKGTKFVGSFPELDVKALDWNYEVDCTHGCRANGVDLPAR